MSEVEKTETSPDSEESFVPPASFETLVQTLAMQAQFTLVSFETKEGKHEPDLPAARHYIDLLGMLQEKTRGNLSLEEQRLLENSLTELRFRYIQAFEDARKKPSAGEPQGAQA
jgi:hypothetical protein